MPFYTCALRTYPFTVIVVNPYYLTPTHLHFLTPSLPHTLTPHRGSENPFGWTIANIIFFKKVRQALGLERCHFPMAGSAPMSQETLTYFMSVNIPIHEIYGMSETTGE